MTYNAIFLILSVVFCVSGILFSLFLSRSGGRRKHFINPMNSVFFGIFTASVLLFIPIYGNSFGDGAGTVKTILASIHNTLRMFVLDGEFNIIEESIQGFMPRLGTVYSLWAAFLHVFAPVLTFSFVLSFFKNLSAYRKYLFCFKRDAYIFSVLNERVIILAESIRQIHPKAAIVFTDVKSGSIADEFNKRAADVGAICFKKCIDAVNLTVHSKNAQMVFFMMGDDDSDNTESTLSVIKTYKQRKNTRLYIFSERIETEMLMLPATEGDTEIKVFRVHETQSMVFNLLYQHSIFANAAETATGEKSISAIIIGMGEVGIELLKALCWCGQMDGYRLIIHIFDKSETAETKFTAECPELMAYNRADKPGEPYYDITFHSPVDYRTFLFTEQIKKIKNVTSVFISAGTDESNIDIALNIRALLEQAGSYPDIFALVRNPQKAELISNHGLRNFKNQNFDITVFGDLKSQYSYDSVMRSKLEREALKLHLRWGAESDFYKFEFNYRSSMALAIHAKWRKECNISEKSLPELEHKRWNAYMRSIGYIYSGCHDKASRNDRAKMHHDLIPFGALNAEEAYKDIAMTQKKTENKSIINHGGLNDV